MPKDVNDQYLLVCFDHADRSKWNDDDDNRVNLKAYPSTLLVYKLTNIKNDLPVIELYYGISIPDAPIYDADFLPSGGYKPESNRLGLVAVATMSPTASVYALPLKVDHFERDYNVRFTHAFIIKSNPYFVLPLTMNNENLKISKDWLYSGQCLQIRWSQVSTIL